MPYRYKLQLLLRGRPVATFQGLNLQAIRSEALAHATEFLRSQPLRDDLLANSFQVVDSEGRLLLVIPVETVADRLQASGCELKRLEQT